MEPLTLALVQCHHTNFDLIPMCSICPTRDRPGHNPEHICWRDIQGRPNWVMGVGRNSHMDPGVGLKILFFIHSSLFLSSWRGRGAKQTELHMYRKAEVPFAYSHAPDLAPACPVNILRGYWKTRQLGYHLQVVKLTGTWNRLQTQASLWIERVSQPWGCCHVIRHDEGDDLCIFWRSGTQEMWLKLDTWHFYLDDARRHTPSTHLPRSFSPG